MAEHETIIRQNTNYDTYTPTDWDCGDTITADKLNKAENAISALGGGTLLIGTTFNETANTLTLDKTGAEIVEAVKNGVLPIVGITTQYVDRAYTVYSLETFSSFGVEDVGGGRSAFVATTSATNQTFESYLDEYPTCTV